MSTRLDQIVGKAKSNPKLRFTSLADLITAEFLQETWRQMNRRGASGVDGETTKEFERDLDRRVQNLCERLKQGSYRAPPVRRVEIPKGPGKEGTRPLGLTHYVSCSRRGRFVVGRKTERKRFNGKLKHLNERLCRLRMAGGKAMMDYVRRHLEGHIRYYGVNGNYRVLSRYVKAASRLLFKWLNRRSQRRSIPWKRFRPIVLERVLPATHSYCPQPLSCADRNDSNWEPDGVTHPVRFYEGSGTYCRVDTIVWHRRATRREQRKQTVSGHGGRNRPTHQIRTVGSARGDGFKRAILKARLYPPPCLPCSLAAICGTSSRRSAHTEPDTTLAEGGGSGRRGVASQRGGDAARGFDQRLAEQPIPALRARPVV